ncbi:HD domain-containing protein [Halobaculum lipolyticum]|uniref:HD domain-containing protein n=1 Tax=Halobaculum lipolyticum TaxID=3032001 RepID=A0ABD5W407_9EURY|nr:HD domain-containing protein [Halobaculum sp. DT31]
MSDDAPDALPDDLADVFPALDDIRDDSLREGVVAAYALALGDTDWTGLREVPWLPDEQARLGLPDETNVDHVNEVTALATGLADGLLASRPALDLDRDLVVAGALLHDVSKLYEFAPGADGADAGTAYYDLLGHPYVGVYVCETAGLPVELSHVVLSHTSRTAVAPATLEAEVVKRADEVAAAAIRSGAVDDLRDA